MAVFLGGVGLALAWRNRVDQPGEGFDLLERVLGVSTRGFCGVAGKSAIGSPGSFWPDRSGLEASATVRADVAEVVLDAGRTEGALVGANPRGLARRWEIHIAEFAVGPKFEYHRVLAVGFVEGAWRRHTACASSLIVMFRYDRAMHDAHVAGARQRHLVAVFVFDGLSPFELAVAIEVFGLERPDVLPRWPYELIVCSEAPGPLRTLGSFDLIPTGSLDDLARADTVIVPGCPDVEGTPSERVIRALQAAHTRGSRIVSICTGAFTLAACGLLDGKTATTHWKHAPLLARRYPNVTVVSDVLYLDHGDVVTSAGTAAGIDVCLHLLRTDHGTGVANRLARRMVVASHREGGQAQYAEHVVLPAVTDTVVVDAIEFSRGRLDERLTLERIADEVHVSPRQLSRRFQDAIGLSPGAWILQERLNQSRDLLARTTESIELVAQKVGLPNTSGYRRRFRAAYGVTPSAYRRTHRVEHPQATHSAA